MGVGRGSANFQPNTVWHHRFVAPGSVLTSSVWEMKPSRIYRAAGVDALARELLLLETFLWVDFFVAMPIASWDEGAMQHGRRLKGGVSTAGRASRKDLDLGAQGLRREPAVPTDADRARDPWRRTTRPRI